MLDKPTSSSQALQCLPNSGGRRGFAEEELKAFTVDTSDKPQIWCEDSILSVQSSVASPQCCCMVVRKTSCFLVYKIRFIL